MNQAPTSTVRSLDQNTGRPYSDTASRDPGTQHNADPDLQGEGNYTSHQDATANR